MKLFFKKNKFCEIFLKDFSICLEVLAIKEEQIDLLVLKDFINSFGSRWQRGEYSYVNFTQIISYQPYHNHKVF